MMSLLAVGTLAYDSVETPSGRADEVLGGAATYFCYAASFFGPVRLMSIVGEDFRASDRELLAGRDVDLAGVEVVPGKSFRWAGRYEGDMNVAETLDTQLNVFEDYEPTVPEAFRDSSFLFLANSPPSMQAHVLDQMRKGTFTAMDTMNLWIDTAAEDLSGVLQRVDLLIINDHEARMLAERPTLIASGRAILELGPQAVIVKKGEHGAFLFSREWFYAIPAFPVETIVDPTGAGDSFAGGVMGYLAQAGEVNEENMKRAMLYGSIVASFNVQDFSLRRFQSIDRGAIETRFQEFLRFTAHP